MQGHGRRNTLVTWPHLRSTIEVDQYGSYEKYV
jgi:hypothetical protein